MPRRGKQRSSVCRATLRPRVINMKYSKIYMDFVCIARHYVITMDYYVSVMWVGLSARDRLVFSFFFYEGWGSEAGASVIFRQWRLRRAKCLRRGGASEPRGSPLSRWRCVRRPEAIRPTLILHLLSPVVVPQPETRPAQNPEARASREQALTEHVENSVSSLLRFVLFFSCPHVNCTQALLYLWIFSH